jgi:FtsP/CotA-like multicopper oxidase with cupredoxin domain
MHTFYKKLTRTLFAFIIAMSGLVLTGAPVLAAPVSIDLCALAGTVTMPDAVVVPIWGFGIPTTPGDCSNATASLPGPVLEVNEGDTVTINLINDLPAGHTLEFEIPGITFDAGLTDGSAPITFKATAPGTYLYQSGGDFGRQEAMGLYGALIVRSLTAGQVYDNPDTAYDVEATLVLSQIDPLFNANPDSYNMYNYLATYWLINGQPYPATSPINAASGQKVLLRYLNAGYDNTSMMLLGMHEHVFARDARLLNNPFDADDETIPAGATEDVLVTIPSTAPPSLNGFPLFNRQLQTGMMTFIIPTP